MGHREHVARRQAPRTLLDLGSRAWLRRQPGDGERHLVAEARQPEDPVCRPVAGIDAELVVSPARDPLAVGREALVANPVGRRDLRVEHPRVGGRPAVRRRNDRRAVRRQRCQDDRRGPRHQHPGRLETHGRHDQRAPLGQAGLKLESAVRPRDRGRYAVRDLDKSPGNRGIVRSQHPPADPDQGEPTARRTAAGARRRARNPAGGQSRQGSQADPEDGQEYARIADFHQNDTSATMT